MMRRPRWEGQALNSADLGIVQGIRQVVAIRAKDGMRRERAVDDFERHSVTVIQTQSDRAAVRE